MNKCLCILYIITIFIFTSCTEIEFEEFESCHYYSGEYYCKIEFYENPENNIRNVIIKVPGIFREQLVKQLQNNEVSYEVIDKYTINIIMNVNLHDSNDIYNIINNPDLYNTEIIYATIPDLNIIQCQDNKRPILNLNGISYIYNGAQTDNYIKLQYNINWCSN